MTTKKRESNLLTECPSPNLLLIFQPWFLIGLYALEKVKGYLLSYDGHAVLWHCMGTIMVIGLECFMTAYVSSTCIKEPQERVVVITQAP